MFVIDSHFLERLGGSLAKPVAAVGKPVIKSAPPSAPHQAAAKTVAASPGDPEPPPDTPRKNRKIGFV